MSIKKAQGIVHALYMRYGVDLVAYQTDEIAQLKDQLEDFLDLEIDTNELLAPEDCVEDLEELDEEEDCCD